MLSSPCLVENIFCNYKLDCSQSPIFFRKIVRIERLPVQAAILVSYVRGGGRLGL